MKSLKYLKKQKNKRYIDGGKIQKVFLPSDIMSNALYNYFDDVFKYSITYFANRYLYYIKDNEDETKDNYYSKLVSEFVRTDENDILYMNQGNLIGYISVQGKWVDFFNFSVFTLNEIQTNKKCMSCPDLLKERNKDLELFNTVRNSKIFDFYNIFLSRHESPDKFIEQLNVLEKAKAKINEKTIGIVSTELEIDVSDVTKLLALMKENVIKILCETLKNMCFLTIFFKVQDFVKKTFFNSELYYKYYDDVVMSNNKMIKEHMVFLMKDVSDGMKDKCILFQTILYITRLIYISRCIIIEDYKAIIQFMFLSYLKSGLYLNLKERIIADATGSIVISEYEFKEEDTKELSNEFNKTLLGFKIIKESTVTFEGQTFTTCGETTLLNIMNYILLTPEGKFNLTKTKIKNENVINFYSKYKTINNLLLDYNTTTKSYNYVNDWLNIVSRFPNKSIYSIEGDINPNKSNILYSLTYLIDTSLPAFSSFHEFFTYIDKEFLFVSENESKLICRDVSVITHINHAEMSIKTSVNLNNFNHLSFRNKKLIKETLIQSESSRAITYEYYKTPSLSDELNTDLVRETQKRLCYTFFSDDNTSETVLGKIYYIYSLGEIYFDRFISAFVDDIRFISFEGQKLTKDFIDIYPNFDYFLEFNIEDFDMLSDEDKINFVNSKQLLFEEKYNNIKSIMNKYLGKVSLSFNDLKDSNYFNKHFSLVLYALHLVTNTKFIVNKYSYNVYTKLLPNLKNINTLQLITTYSNIDLSLLYNLPKLQILSLVGVSIKNFIETYKDEGKNSIKTLSLMKCNNIPDDGLLFSKVLYNTITSLTISQCMVKKITWIQDITNLTSLQLDKIPITTYTQINSKNLEKLVIQNTGIETYEDLITCPKLQSFTLQNCKIKEIVNTTFHSSCKNLTFMNLPLICFQNCIFENLVQLTLISTNTIIFENLTIPNLIHLEINNSPIKQILSCKFPKLGTISLKHCNNLTNIDITDLENKPITTLKTMIINKCNNLESIKSFSNSNIETFITIYSKINLDEIIIFKHSISYLILGDMLNIGSIDFYRQFTQATVIKVSSENSETNEKLLKIISTLKEENPGRIITNNTMF